MTTTEEKPAMTPALRAPRISWRAWGILWVVVIAVQGALLMNDAAADTWLWRATRWVVGDQEGYSWAKYQKAHANDPEPRPFYMTRTPPMTKLDTPTYVPEARFFKRTEAVWRVFKDFAENSTLFFLMLVLAIYNRRRWKAAVMLLLGTLAAGGVSTLIRMIGGRYRPVAPPLMDGVNRWELFRGFHDTANLSWPSGHATVAFATAAVLTYVSPKGAWLWIAIATGTAVSRVVMLAHFPADANMAAAVGWTVAWCVAVGVDRVIKDPAAPASAANQ